jgi:carbon storage regulator
MLVLSRKIGEKIMIGDGIVVVVKRILGQRVTFGIEAPESVRIVRAELPRFDEAPTQHLPNGKHLPNGNRVPNGNHVPSVLLPVQPR